MLSFGEGVQVLAEDAFAAQPDGNYRAEFRPNHIRLDAHSGTAVSFRCTLGIAEITGSETFLHLSHGDDKWVALIHGVHLGQNAGAAWGTVIMMDVWHWTSLVVLLAYAGLQSIPGAYSQAARIDQASRWAIFRYVELPKRKGVLLIAILLRLMDSFMIYTEPFVVTGGGPGSDTTFLSIDLVKMALGQLTSDRRRPSRSCVSW